MTAHLALSVLLGVIACGCEGRPRSEASPSEPRSSRYDPHVAEIDLRRGAPERAEDALFAVRTERSFSHLVERLRSLQQEEELEGLLVLLGTSRLGFARSSEAGRLLATFRQRGLPVLCHADGLGNSSMLLVALGCDEVWLSPPGTVDTVGIAAQLLFGRSLLEKLSIQADFLQAGRYKGAIEPFTRDSSSPEARESLQSTLAALREAWLDSIASGREQEVDALGLEDGPHVAEQARELGLVDRIGFDHEAREAALARAGVDNRVVYFGGQEEAEPTLAELVRILTGTSRRVMPHVVVVRATGAITMAGGSLLGGEGIAARSFIKMLRRIAEDDNVKAVVLRLDSPGGSALASDLLWNELMRVRKRKPIVASVGAMAASGGCYLASAASEVVAEETSIIGSIGVMGGKFSFESSLAELGITVETVRANEDTGSRALLESPLAAWDEATRAKVRTAIEEAYELFLKRVAEGRGKSTAQIRPAAEGRLFGGVAGKAHGLVDHLGGLSQAIDRALELAELPEDTPVVIADPPTALLDLLGIQSPEGRRRTAERLERQGARAAARAVTGALEPVRTEVQTFVASVTPLLQGERVLAALPYVLTVR